MSAEVEILTARRPDALVIPPAAVKVEDGHEVCYVVGAEGPERREIAVGQVTPDLLEVTGGLNEGEEIVLEPHRINPAEVVIKPAAPSVAATKTTAIQIARAEPAL